MAMRIPSTQAVAINSTPHKRNRDFSWKWMMTEVYSKKLLETSCTRRREAIKPY
jgi:hypothetical protein